MHDHFDRCARHIKRENCVVEVDPCLISVNWGGAFWGDDMVLGNSFADGKSFTVMLWWKRSPVRLTHGKFLSRRRRQ
ncbi:hypothetical protein NXW50_30855 [Bacteroides thetaiotaomicron]|nr:hypothetical protein [Bacteroides thetaiotaomicron]MCS2282367.1 hypothetical protein [Bacteroides thetaiotaomicron]